MKKFVAMMLAMLMVIAMLAGCGSSNAAPAADNANTLKIGLTGPLTGGASEYGLAVRGGMEIAVAEINARAVCRLHSRLRMTKLTVPIRLSPLTTP